MAITTVNSYLTASGLNFRSGTTGAASILLDSSTHVIKLSGNFNVDAGSLTIGGNPIVTGSSSSEGDTLATVTARGASTSSNLSLAGNITTANGKYIGIGSTQANIEFGNGTIGNELTDLSLVTDSNGEITFYRGENKVIIGSSFGVYNSDFFVDTDTLYVDASADSVGIGTATPSADLHIHGSDPVLKIRDSSTSDNTATLWLQESDTYGVKINYESNGGHGGLDYLTIDTFSASDSNNQAGNHANAWGLDQRGNVLPHKGAVDGNLLRPYEWNLYGTQSSGSTPSFPQNGATEENERIYGENPFGEPAILWHTPSNDSGDNADGGWNSDTFVIDRGKSYRTSVWVKKTTTNRSDGNLYLGTSFVANISNSTYNSNPYFIGGTTMASAGMETGQWYLMVGYIYDSGHTGTTHHPDGGIYDRNGEKIYSATSFKFTDSGSPTDGLGSQWNTSRQRVYNYYDATTGSKTYWWGPRFEPLEASTPTLKEILNTPSSDTGAFFMGAVGVGTSSHSQTNEVKLHVYKNANRATTVVQNNNHVARFEAYGSATAIDTTASNGVIIRNNGTNRVHFDAGGNVGIGVDDPDSKLEVQTSAGAPMLHLRPNGASTAINPVILYRNQLEGSANYMLCQGVSTFFGTFEGGVPDDPSDMIKLQPNSSANPQLHIGDAGSSAAALNVGGNIKLLNNGDSYLNGGDVGIGVTNPAKQLTLNAAEPFIRLEESSSGGNKRLDLFVSNSTGVIGANQSAQTMMFQTVGETRMTIEAGGDVGIGTTNPQTKLTVGSDGDEDGLEVRESGNLKFKVRPSSSHAYLSLYDSTVNEDIRLNTNGDSWIGGGSLAVGMTDPSTSRVRIKGGTSDSSSNALQCIDSSSTQMFYVRNDGVVGVDHNYFYASASAGAYVQHDLRVRGSLSNDAGTLAINGDVNFDANTLFVDSSTNRIGIGTTNPQEELDLRGDMRLDSAGNTDRSIYFRNQSSVAKVRSDAALQFDVGVSSSPTAAMYIEEDTRDVGIGITSPTSKLHIYGGNVTGLAGSLRNDSKNRMNMKVAMTDVTRYIGTVTQYGNGDSAGFTIRIYDGAEKVFRIVRVVVQNSSGTNYPSITVEGGGEDTDIHIDLKYKNRDGDATKTDFFLDPTGTKYFNQYIEIEGFIFKETGYNTTSLSSCSLDDDLALNVLDHGNGSRVGIGTTDPSAKLHAEGSMIVKGDASWAGTDNQNGAIFMNTAGRGLKGAFSTSYARNLILSNSNYIDLGEQSSLVYGFRFYAGSTASPVGTYDFFTSGSNSRLHIEKGGNIAIGNTSAGAKLDIRTDSSTTNGVGLRLESSTGAYFTVSHGGQVNIGSTLYLDNNEIWAKNSNNLNLKADGVIRIQPQSYGTAATFATNGYVGIGSTSPAYHLDVTGVVNAYRFLQDGNVGNNFYAIQLSRSSASDSNPDIYGSDNGLVLGANASEDVLKLDTGNTVLIRGGSDPDTNSYKADFAVGCGGNPQISWRNQQVQIGGTDMNWAGKIYHDGIYNVAAWASNLRLFTQAGAGSAAYDIIFSPWDGNNLNETMRILGEGRVGIGTSAPVSDFTVYGNDSNSATASIHCISNNETGALLRLVEGDNHQGGFIQYDGNNNKLNIGVHNTNDTTFANDSGAITIDRQTAKVGIGTTTTSAHLTIANTDPKITLYDTAGANSDPNGEITFNENATSENFAIKYNGANDRLEFNSPLDGNTGIMVITRSERVGIGSSSPTDILTINQTADSNGIRINGYDDHSSSFVKLFVKSAGHAELTQSTNGGAGYLKLSAENYLQLAAGTFVYTDDQFRIYDAGQLSLGNGADFFLKYDNSIDKLKIHSSTNDGITMDISGRVGIGTTDPLGTTHIYTADAGGTIATNSSHDDLIIENNGNCGIQLSSPASSYQYLAFGDTASANQGYVRYYHSSDRMDLRAGGTDTLSIVGGDVGIGTTGPSAKLHVAGGNILVDSQYGIRFNDANTRIYTNAETPEDLIIEADQDLLLTPDGNVGIGTTSINAGAKVTIQANNENVIATGLVINSYQSTTGTAGNGVGIVMGQNNGVYSSKIANVWTNNNPSYLQTNIAFYTMHDSYAAGSETEKMRLTSQGRLGIGVTNPTRTLHVQGDAEINTNLVANTAVYTKDWYGIGSNDQRILTSAGTAQVTIKNDGSVGIGSTSPLQKLDVAGVIRSSSTSRIQADTYNNSANSANIIYRSSSKTIVGNNASALVILDGGNVGIGTTDPVVLLHVDGSSPKIRLRDNDAAGTPLAHIDASDGALKLQADSSDETASSFLTLEVDGSEHVRVASDGKVGIGSTDPDYTLTVDAGATNEIARFRSTDNDALISIQDNTDTVYIGHDASLDVMSLGFSNSVGVSSNVNISTGGQVGIGTNKAGDGVSLDIHTPTNKNAIVVREDTDDSITHNMYIDSSDNAVMKLYSDGASEKIRFNTAGTSYFIGGSVGIGTSSASYDLHVEGEILAESNMLLGGDGTYGSTYGAIGIGTTSLTNGHHRIFAKSSDHMYFAAATSKGFRFRPNGGATSASAGVTIASDGDVGIGTTNPSSKLEVQGTIQTQVYGIGSLPSASPAGQRAMVNDSYYTFGSSTIGQTVYAGGSAVAPVYSDGSYWRYG